MFKKAESLFSSSDVSIFAAAVSDYAPIRKAKQKIKKDANVLSIEFKKTKDILSAMSKRKTSKQFLVGFALETENEIENAKLKLNQKNLDMIILNSLNNKGAGFEFSTNKITIIEKGNNIIDFKLKHKRDVAKDIISNIITKLQ